MLKTLRRLLLNVTEIKEQDSTRTIVGKGVARVTGHVFILAGSIALPSLVVRTIIKLRNADSNKR